MKYECPKCSSKNAWLRKSGTELLLVCFCGLQKVLYTALADTIEGPLDDEPEANSKLPVKSTHLYRALVVLSILPEGSSKDITERMNELNGVMRVPGKILRTDLLLTVSDVSSYLTILRGKGLVDRAQIRRGVKGGSTWVLTQESIDLLGIEDETDF